LQQGDAKAAIIDQLKDPESAKFSDILVKGEMVCGQVNAKNSMGGYVGKRYWIYDANRKGRDVGRPEPGDLDQRCRLYHPTKRRYLQIILEQLASLPGLQNRP
jgi:hypothetical protein